MNYGRKLLFIGMLTLAFASTQSVKADEIIEPNNTPMGTFAKMEDQEVPAYRGATPVLAPDDLDAGDTSLPRKDVIDIASYQKWMTLSDFQKIKAQGVKSVVVKLTQGVDYVNPYAKQQISYARQAGLTIAVYHYTTLGGWDTTTQAQAEDWARREAKFFADTARSLGLDTGTAMINDAEDGNVRPEINWTNASLQFANQLKVLGFSNVKHYTSLNWTTAANKLNPNALGHKNMWVAQYLYGKPSANNLRNTEFGAWQYSSQMYYRDISQRSPIDTSIAYISNFFSPTSGGSTPVFRMYNKNTGEHFYTISGYEKDSLVKSGWTYEGIGWNAPKSGTPVYRIYNPNAKGGDHYYTISKYEADHNVSLGWKWDNGGEPAFYAGGNINVYVQYNPNAESGSHNYTVNKYEHENLLKNGWKYGSVAWKAQ